MVFARASRWLVVGGQPEAVGEHTSTAVAMVAVHLPGFTSLLGGMEAEKEGVLPARSAAKSSTSNFDGGDPVDGESVALDPNKVARHSSPPLPSPPLPPAGELGWGRRGPCSLPGLGPTPRQELFLETSRFSNGVVAAGVAWHVGASLPLRLCTLCTAAPLHCCRVCCPQWLERGNLPWPPGRPACFLCLLCIACSCSVLVPVLLLWLSSVLVLSPFSVSCSCCLLACLPRLACTTTSQPSPQPSPAQCRRRASILCCALSARPSWDLHPCCAPPSCRHPRATHAQPSSNRPTLACPRQPTHAHASPSPTPARREPRRAETSRDCAT